jgi:hypothetical protein
VTSVTVSKIVPHAGDLNDIFEYAAYLGHTDALQGKAPAERIFNNISPLSSSVREELQLIYDLAYESELVASPLYWVSEVTVDMFIRKWDDTTGWGVLETVMDGRLLRLDFSYHDLPAELADHKFDDGSILKVTIVPADQKIIKIEAP